MAVFFCTGLGVTIWWN